jgi:hypothetical protein
MKPSGSAEDFDTVDECGICTSTRLFEVLNLGMQPFLSYLWELEYLSKRDVGAFKLWVSQNA